MESEDDLTIDLKKNLFLILIAIIICSILAVAIANSRSLSSLFDNYENETYISFSEDIVRNATSNCMQLNSTTSTRNFIDFTEYTQVDALNRINLNSSHAEYDSIERDDDNIYCYKDYGAGNLADFYYEFDVVCEDLEDTARQYRFNLFSIAETRGDYKQVRNNDLSDMISINFAHDGDATKWTFGILENQNAVTWSNFSTTEYNLDTWYYFSMNKTGTTFIIEAFSDSARTTLIEDLRQTLQANYTFRYIMWIQSIEYAGANEQSGFIKDAWNGSMSAGGFVSEGYFITTELDFNETWVAVITNTSLNGGVITIEFSEDNSTWMNHNNVSGSDTLIEGLEAIELEDLQYINGTMRLNFTDGVITPRLYSLELVYSGVATSNEDYAGLLVIGLIIGIVIMLGAGKVLYG